MSRKPKCAFRGCKAPPRFCWGLCSHGDIWLCSGHDVELNLVILRWLGKRRIEQMIAKYIADAQRQAIAERTVMPTVSNVRCIS